MCLIFYCKSYFSKGEGDLSFWTCVQSQLHYVAIRNMFKSLLLSIPAKLQCHQTSIRKSKWLFSNTKNCLPEHYSCQVVNASNMSHSYCRSSNNLHYKKPNWNLYIYIYIYICFDQFLRKIQKSSFLSKLWSEGRYHTNAKM